MKSSAKTRLTSIHNHSSLLRGGMKSAWLPLLLGLVLTAYSQCARAQIAGGSAVNLNGTSGYASVALAPPLSNYTISAWVYLRSGGVFANPRVAIVSSTTCGATTEFLIRGNASANDAQYLQLGRCFQYEGATSTNPVPLNTWVQVSVSVADGPEGSLVSFYINGAPAGSSLLPLTNNTSLGTNLALGYNNGSSRKFDGLLDEVQIWQGTVAPITNHVISGAEANLVAYYRFDEGSGTNGGNIAIAPNATGATLQGSAAWVTIPAPPFPAGTPVPGGDWVAQGPRPIRDLAGLGENSGAKGIAPDYPVEGSVYDVAPHPTNHDIIYAAGPNGGIWKTVNATSTNISWIPLTDQQPALSIGCLEFDPTDPTFQTLVAGFGGYSSGGSYSGGMYSERLGLLRTTDGGGSWQQIFPTNLLGAHLTSVAARGNVLLAASGFYNDTTTKGLYRSTNGGLSFSKLSGSGVLPVGDADSLASVPNSPNRLYVAIRSSATTCDIYRTDDTGANWTPTALLPLTNTGPATNSRVWLTVHNTNGFEVVYVLVLKTDYSGYVFFSTNAGDNWQPAGQISNYSGSYTHSSFAADPLDPLLTYVGGTGFNVRRVDRSKGATNNIELTGYYVLGKRSVHVDSHSIKFDAYGNLIEVNDGGIYLLPRLAATTGANGVTPVGDDGWRSLIGNLQLTEFWTIAYDSLSKTLFGGSQDNGLAEQRSSGSKPWDMVYGGDSFKVAIDTRSSPGYSIRYYSASYLTPATNISDTRIWLLSKWAYGSGEPVATNTMPLSVLTGGPFVAGSFAMEINTVDPRRLIICDAYTLFESTDQGQTARKALPNESLFNQFSRMVYGGVLNGVPNPDVIWAGGTNYGTNGPYVIALRTNAAYPFTFILSKMTNEPIGIVANPSNWREAFYLTKSNIFQSINAGQNWSDITANLYKGARFQTLEFLPLPSGDALAVGTDDGVYITRLSSVPKWWTRLGSSLPRAMARSLHYDPSDQILAVGTFGRGAWTYSLAGWPQMGGPGMAVEVRPVNGNYIRSQFVPALSNNYTMSAWINLRSGGTFPNPRVAVISSTNCGGGTELLIRSATTNITDQQFLQLARCNVFGGALSTKPVPLNQWVHVAVTVGPTLGSGGSVSNLVSYYVNGQAAGSSYFANLDLTIGPDLAIAFNNGSTRKFDGGIDQVAIWATSISPSLIPLTMSRQPTGNAIDGALAMVLNFDEGTGTNALGATTPFAVTNANLMGTVNWQSSGALLQQPASAATRPAQKITSSSATLSGIVAPQSLPAQGQFEYGPTTSYGMVASQSLFAPEVPSLDGANDFIATSQLVSAPQSFSLGLWFKTSSKTGGRLLGFGSTQTNASPQLDRHLYLGTDGLVRFGVFDTNYNVITGGTACNDGRWHHVMGTYSQSNGMMRLYLDGVEVASKANLVAPFAYNGYWRMGWDAMANWPGAATNSFYAGAMAEVQIWNTELTANFITANYQCPLAGTEPGLVTYYHLDEGGVGNTIVSDSAPAEGQNLGYLYGEPASTLALDLPGCVSQTIANLEPATTYHFRLAVTNATGTNYSADRTFTTLPPALSAVANGSSVLLSWQHPATGFLLEQSPTLSPPVWSLLPPPYTTNGTAIETNLPVGGDNEFFRLRRP